MTHTQTWVNKTLKSWTHPQARDVAIGTSKALKTYLRHPLFSVVFSHAKWYEATELPDIKQNFQLISHYFHLQAEWVDSDSIFFSHISHILHSSIKQKQTHKMLTANSISLKKKINTLKANKLHQNVSTKVSVSILCYFTLLRGKATFYPTTYN